MKPNNILIERDEDHGMVIEQVQLTDIEDAAHVPPGYDILDKQVGNWMWRSPEAHAKGRVNKASDLFSFGVVVSRQAQCKPSSLGMACSLMLSWSAYTPCLNELF